MYKCLNRNIAMWLLPFKVHFPFKYLNTQWLQKYIPLHHLWQKNIIVKTTYIISINLQICKNCIQKCTNDFCFSIYAVKLIHLPQFVCKKRKETKTKLPKRWLPVMGFIEITTQLYRNKKCNLPKMSNKQN